MQAVLWYHIDVVSMVLSRRAGTLHDINWQSYEGIVMYWMLAYGKAHHGWTKAVKKYQESMTNKCKPNHWVNVKARLSHKATSMV